MINGPFALYIDQTLEKIKRRGRSNVDRSNVDRSSDVAPNKRVLGSCGNSSRKGKLTKKERQCLDF